MSRRRQRSNEGEVMGFVTGLMLGVIVSVPLAAWLTPRSGEETRQQIAHTGLIVRRKAADTVRKPIEQVQEKIEDLRGESVEESLAEGRSIAAQYAANTTAPQ